MQRRSSWYDKFTDKEKKEFLHSFIDRIEIYEDEQPDGRFLKSLSFRFPVFYDGQEIRGLSWDKETTVDKVLCCFRDRDGFGKFARDTLKDYVRFKGALIDFGHTTVSAHIT